MSDKVELRLSEDHANFLTNNAGTTNVEKAIMSTLTVEMLKLKLSELVPLLTDMHKEEFRRFVAKKFRLEIPNAGNEEENTKQE